MDVETSTGAAYGEILPNEGQALARRKTASAKRFEIALSVSCVRRGQRTNASRSIRIPSSSVTAVFTLPVEGEGLTTSATGKLRAASSVIL